MHPGRGSAKEATSGVFAGPAWPDFSSPEAASLGGIPARPPAAARAAGEAAGLDGSGNSMDLNVPKLGPAATSRHAAPHARRGRGRGVRATLLAGQCTGCDVCFDHFQP